MHRPATHFEPATTTGICRSTPTNSLTVDWYVKRCHPCRRQPARATAVEEDATSSPHTRSQSFRRRSRGDGCVLRFPSPESAAVARWGGASLRWGQQRGGGC